MFFKNIQCKLDSSVPCKSHVTSKKQCYLQQRTTRLNPETTEHYRRVCWKLQPRSRELFHSLFSCHKKTVYCFSTVGKTNNALKRAIFAGKYQQSTSPCTVQPLTTSRREITIQNVSSLKKKQLSSIHGWDCVKVTNYHKTKIYVPVYFK